MLSMPITFDMSRKLKVVKMSLRSMRFLGNDGKDVDEEILNDS